MKVNIIKVLNRELPSDHPIFISKLYNERKWQFYYKINNSIFNRTRWKGDGVMLLLTYYLLSIYY